MLQEAHPQHAVVVFVALFVFVVPLVPLVIAVFRLVAVSGPNVSSQVSSSDGATATQTPKKASAATAAAVSRRTTLLPNRVLAVFDLVTDSIEYESVRKSNSRAGRPSS